MRRTWRYGSLRRNSREAPWYNSWSQQLWWCRHVMMMIMKMTRMVIWRRGHLLGDKILIVQPLFHFFYSTSGDTLNLLLISKKVSTKKSCSFWDNDDDLEAIDALGHSISSLELCLSVWRKPEENLNEELEKLVFRKLWMFHTSGKGNKTNLCTWFILDLRFTSRTSFTASPGHSRVSGAFLWDW